MEKLTIDMGRANLIVEKYEDTEFIVYVQDKKTDCITQDIVTVRQAPNHDALTPDAVECLVWADEDAEDYTHQFIINQFSEEP